MPAATRVRGRPATKRPELPSALAQACLRFKGFLRVECGFSHNTILSYMRDVADLCEHLTGAGVTALGEVQPRHLVEHVQALRSKKKHASSTVVRHHASIRCLFRWGWGNGLVKEDPTTILERPTRWKNLPKVLSVAQTRQLIKAAGEGDGSRRRTITSAAEKMARPLG